MGKDDALVAVLAMIILAGAGLMYGAMVNRRKIREMEHRERLAMIERGIAPPPGRPWEGAPSLARTAPGGTARFRSAGVVLIGIGLGLFFIIGFAAGLPSIGIGIGGAWAVVGAALLFNHHLLAQRDADGRVTPPAGWTPPRPNTPAEPPDNIAP